MTTQEIYQIKSYSAYTYYSEGKTSFLEYLTNNVTLTAKWGKFEIEKELQS